MSLKLDGETRVTTPDGFLTQAALEEVTGFKAKHKQAEKLKQLSINFVSGSNVLFVRAEEVFGKNQMHDNTEPEENNEPNFECLLRGKNAEARSASKGSNKKEG